jgi:hypothetical protein
MTNLECLFHQALKRQQSQQQEQEQEQEQGKNSSNSNTAATTTVASPPTINHDYNNTSNDDGVSYLDQYVESFKKIGYSTVKVHDLCILPCGGL